MFRATISLSDEAGIYLGKTGRKTSESIEDVIADYQFAYYDVGVKSQFLKSSLTRKPSFLFFDN